MRTNVGLNTNYIFEGSARPPIFQEQIAAQPIGQIPPTDFGKPLDASEIVRIFDISASDLHQFQTYKDGVAAFSITQSASSPWIFKVSNMLLVPFTANPQSVFTAIGATSKVNMLETVIPGYFNEEYWRGIVTRTDGSGNLSRSGIDTVQETQFPFILDNGYFIMYGADIPKNSKNYIQKLRPPAVTCYIYKNTGEGFGLQSIVGQITALSTAVLNVSTYSGTALEYVSSLTYTTSTFEAEARSSLSTLAGDIFILNSNAELQWSNVTTGLAYVRGQVMIGNTEPRDPAFLFDVQGIANIDEVLTTSVTTYSDKRLKMNINNMSTNNNILDLASFEYNYIMRPEVTEIGFIAQDVERVAPQIVREHNGYKTIQYDRLGVLLLPIVKQQQQQIDTLICELSDLKGLFMRSSESMSPPLLSLEGRTSRE